MTSQQGSTRKRGATWTAYWFIPCPGGKHDAADGTANGCAAGHPWQRSKGGFRTQKLARSHLTTVLGHVQAGTYSEPRRVTLAAFLTEHWLPTLDGRNSTKSNYRNAVKWIVPHLGGVTLPQLTPAHVQAWLGVLRESGRLRDGGPLSPRAVQLAYTVLKMALDHAVSQGFIARNPAAAVKRPRASRSTMKFWDEDQAGTFLGHAAGDRLEAMWTLFLTRGFRRGELVGLSWPNVDLTAGRLSVIDTIVLVDGKPEDSDPKTDAGRRSVPIDADLVSVLRAHRKRQLEDRMAWGAGWVDSRLVFTRENGAALDPEYVSTRFETLTRKAGVPTIRLHDCRHTAASLALKAGIPVKVVSEWLGHSSVSITYDLYSHVIPSMSEELGAKLTAIVRGR